MSSRPIYNRKLLQHLQYHNTEIVISKEIKVPLAGWGKCVIFPIDLANELTQQEFESVVSHELEHLRWNDTVVRMMIHLLASVYWWVPIKKWLYQMEQEQELASDASVHRYNLNSVDLATALRKTILKQQLNAHQCAAFAKKIPSPKQILIERIKAALNPQDLQKQNKAFAAAGIILMLGLALILGFVIC